VRRLPGWLWHALVLEVTMYKNLLRWIFRRPSVGPAEEPIGYARAVTPVMGLWIFASAAEMPLIHVLLPWAAARLVMIVLGLWTVVWMLGMLAGLRTYPHLVTPDALRVRSGALVDVRIPWDAIATVRHREVDLPSSVRTLQPLETDEGTHLRVGVSGRTNLAVGLSRPLLVTPSRRRELTVTQVDLWVDEPREVARVLRERADSAALRAGRAGRAEGP
jgi:hypothetical protein